VKAPFSVLVSFWYYQTDRAVSQVLGALCAARDRGQPVRLLVDSGAFSADTQGHRITVEDYRKWLTDLAVPEFGPWMVGAITLDVLRDPEATYGNWTALRDAGLDTIPVVHLGDPVTAVDNYVAAGADYLALGAMVGRSIVRKTRWAAHVHRHLRDTAPDVRLHALGVSSQQLVEALPWWSVDSSSFGSGYRYGRIHLYDPTRRKLESVPLDGRTPYQFGRLLRDVYGVDPGDIERSTPENRTLLIALSAWVVAAWQRDLQDRRPVTAPPSRGGPGPHVHQVDGPGELTAALAAVGPHVHGVEGWPDYLAEWIGSGPGPHVHYVDANAEMVAGAIDSHTETE
jgi:hypothetical protein